eukprot:g16539.t1
MLRIVFRFVLLAAGDGRPSALCPSERRPSEVTVTTEQDGTQATTEDLQEGPNDEASFGVLPDLPDFKGEVKATGAAPRKAKGRVVPSRMGKQPKRPT